MKRIAIMGVVLLFALAATGCSAFGGPPTESTETTSFVMEESYRQELETAWSYRHLDGRMQAAYEQLYVAVRKHELTDDGLQSTEKNGQTRLSLRVTLAEPLLSKDEASRVYLALTTDQPRFFFLDNQYSVSSYRQDGTEKFTAFDLYFIGDAASREKAAGRLETAVANVIGTVDVQASAFEKELRLHDQLTAMCTYEKAALAQTDPLQSYPQAFTAYGALVDGRAVCEGYARALQLLLQRVGIECTLVNGVDSNGVAHMWNLVKVDGAEYHVDPTWNDTDDQGQHIYFNMTTQDITRTHAIGEDNIGVGVCTAEDANYFRHQGLWLDTLQREEIVSVIAGEVRRGRAVIELRFSEEAYPNARLVINNSALVIREVNELLATDGSIVWEYDRYSADEQHGVLTLYSS